MGGKAAPALEFEFTKKIILYIPNFSARKKTVLKHDFHHVVTGYPLHLKMRARLAHGKLDQVAGITGVRS